METSKAYISGPFIYTRRPLWVASLPLQKTFIVIIYAAFITFLLTWKSIKYDGNYHERIAFRAAWITTTQTSLPFLLALRINPIGLLLGTSYERLNWLHRWVSRIFIVSATIHGTFFTVEWLAASFFWAEIKTVSMVKWGYAAWVVLIWTAMSTLPFFRRIKYEFFVLQHILSVVLLFVFLLLHVPEHHLFSIWCAVGVFVCDVASRSASMLLRSIRNSFSSGCEAQVKAVDDELTLVTIPDARMGWTPGQHVLIWSPSFRWESPHPFTIANAPSDKSSRRELLLTLKTKRGLTKKLNVWARKTENAGGDGNIRFVLTEPYGSLPNWRQYEQVVLIGASTGGSFVTPVLEDLLKPQSQGCIRNINALYIVRRKSHVYPYIQRISLLVLRAKEMGMSVRIEVAITKDSKTVSEAVLEDDPANESRERLIGPDDEGGAGVELERFSLDSLQSEESTRDEQLLKEEVELGLDGFDSSIMESQGRPDVASFIRSAVRDVPGSTAVAVCGGRAIERVVQTTVASLRGERTAEGMGVNEIFLHVERSDI